MAAARIEHRGRLVQNKHLGVHGKSAGNGHALLLSAREGVGLVLLKAHEAHACEGVRHALRKFACGDAQVFWSKGNIVFHERGDQLIVGVLKHHAYTRAHVVDQLRVGGVQAVDFDAAAIGHEQGVQVLGEG